MFDDEADDVGQEIEAFCARCKTDTPHTVVSRYDEEIRRVRCNTCDDVHAFRRPRGEDGDEPSEQPGRKKLVKAKPTWEQVINKKKSTPRPWGLDEVFCELDVLVHSVFGVGFVSELIGQNKIEVTFQSDKRILIHNRRLMPLHVVQRQRQEAEARARADGKAKAKEAREAKAAAREAARLAKAHESDIDDLDMPDMLGDDLHDELPGVPPSKSPGMGKTTKLSARELAALEDEEDDDSIPGDLDEESSAPRGRGRKGKSTEPPGGRPRLGPSVFMDSDSDDDDADFDGDDERPAAKSKSGADGKRRVGRPPGKKTGLKADAPSENEPATSKSGSKSAKSTVAKATATAESKAAAKTKPAKNTDGASKSKK